MSGPRIDLHTTGSSVDGKAGCGVVAKYTDEYGRESTRKFTHPIGAASQRRASLQAVHIGLAAIIRPMRRACAVRVLCKRDLHPLLDSLDQNFSSDEDADVLMEIARWSTFYDDLKFAPCDEGSLLGQDLAKECAESQSGTDTGTVVE